MKQIFKNYLATFIKNWLQTIGTVLFILMMFAVVIGFLAAPLQIYAHLTSANVKNVKFNQQIYDDRYTYNNEFLYKFLYDGEKNHYKYEQVHTTNGIEDGTQKHEVLREGGLKDNNQELLSDAFKKATDVVAGHTVAINKDGTVSYTASSFATDQDRYDAYGSYLRNGINAYENGALSQAGSNFTLFADGIDAPAEEEAAKNAYINNINNLITYTIADLKNSNDLQSNSVETSRVASIVTALLSSGGTNYKASDLLSYMSHNTDNYIGINKAIFDKDKKVVVLNTDEAIQAGFNQWTYASTGGKTTPFGMANISVDGKNMKDGDKFPILAVSAKAGDTKIVMSVKDGYTPSKIGITSFRNAKAGIDIIADKSADDITAPSVSDAPSQVNATATKDFGQSIIDLIKDEMKDTNKKSQTVHLIGAQVFNSENNMAVSKDDGIEYASSNMYRKLESTYSYDFLSYIAAAAFNDENNINAFNGDKQNYSFGIENTMFFSEKDLSSLFPKRNIVLKTVNSQNEPNQLQLSEGRLPTKLDISQSDKQDYIEQVMDGDITPEIVVNSGYAKHNKLKLGDVISLPESTENTNISSNMIGKGTSDDFLTSEHVKYKIVGIGEKFDDLVPSGHYTPYMEDIKTFTNAYVDDEWFNILKEAKWYNSNSGTSDFTNTIRVKNAKGVKADPANVFNFNINDKNANNGLYDTARNPFENYKDTLTMRNVNTNKIKVIIFIILGVAVLVLAFIFINFIITKELNETRRQIGIFKSFGYKISELSWIFAIKTFLTIFVGAVLGWVVSIAIQIWSAGNYMQSVMFKFDSIYGSPAFLCIIFIVIPLIFLAVSYFMTIYYLKEPTLSLLSNGTKVKKGKTHVGPLLKHLAKVGKGFGYRLQQGFVKDSMGKFVVVQILFAVASLTFTLMFGAQGLMYGIANQGFAVLNKNADHNFWWANANGINIAYGKTKYSIDNLDKYKDRNFKYISYGNDKKIGEVIDADKDMSDSRYAENYLISSISNTFESSKDLAMEMMMPLDYYLVNYAKVTPASLPTEVDNLINPITGAVKDIIDPVTNQSLYKEAADKDKDIPSLMATMEPAYYDYYLNWILAYRIEKIGTDTLNEIKANLISGNVKYTLKDLITDVKNTSNNPNDDIKLNMGALLTDPNVKDKFQQTLFGLTDETDGKKNNLFLADITKIITLVMADSYATNGIKGQLVNTPKPTSEDIAKAISAAKKDSLWNDFSPNNSKYWGMNSPLMKDILSGASTGSSTSGSSTSGSASSASGTNGMSLTGMSSQTVDLITGASMLGETSKSLSDSPVITINQAFFNKDKNALFYNIPVTGVSDIYGAEVTLFDYKNNEYGKYENLLTHKGVSDSTYKRLADDTGDKNSVYAVVPYVLAKTKGLKVGDKLVVSTDTKQKQSITLDIIGINKSVTYSLTSWSIDVDYTQFINKFFDEDSKKELAIGNEKSLPIFNDMMSTEPLMQGNINLKDIPGSMQSMRFVGKNLAMSIKPGSSIFGSIFGGAFPISSLLGLPTDDEFTMITNPSIAASGSQSTTTPYNILRAGVNNAINQVNNILIVFMVLVAVMLLIILVVVMNIIVEQATPIILTLKSLGYNQKEINWITMGSYITGALISFVVAYCLSLLIWNVFLVIAANLWHIYVFMTYTWEAPVITFLVVGAILFIGWFVSDRKVQKIPLTLVTGFN